MHRMEGCIHVVRVVLGVLGLLKVGFLVIRRPYGLMWISKNVVNSTSHSWKVTTFSFVYFQSDKSDIFKKIERISGACCTCP